ncbi:hypothetical protein [Chitinophaga sp. S165]|uniref:hypothetical protein n=1 Tax=Chitinophaga sp. S165 TaxID=2135462 RepID=UPI000D7182D0|nr:hypothetical protein [Chitinophaga sp. S165]PWV46213.1 hypothetical protein C7475_111116 [Chitinophaga sp. S165]
MTNEQISELIRAAHSYYPIGFADYSDMYTGKQAWLQVLENKINNLDSAPPLEWVGLVDALRRRYGADNVFDNAFRQFPSYSLSVILSTHIQVDNISFTRSMITDISLLCKCYTVFFEDRYVVKAYADYSGSVMDTSFTVLFTLSDKETAETLASVQELISTAYSGYVYVSHHTLFDIKISGSEPYHVPFLVDRQYTVYDLLMSDGYHLSVPRVLI